MLDDVEIAQVRARSIAGTVDSGGLEPWPPQRSVDPVDDDVQRGSEEPADDLGGAQKDREQD
jgi:hypothetical protein